MRNPIIPGRIAERWANHTRLDRVQWHPLVYENRTYTGSLSKINSWTTDTDGITQIIEVTGGSPSTTKPGDSGNLIGWDLSSIQNPMMDLHAPQMCLFHMKLVANPGNGSRCVVMMGATNNMSALPTHNWSGCGLHFHKSSPGPDLRVGHVYNAAGADAGPKAITEVYGSMFFGPDTPGATGSSVEAFGINSSGSYETLKRQVRSDLQYGDGSPDLWRFFIHAGKATTTSGAKTIKVQCRVAVSSIVTPPTWFPGS